ncbi:MAG: hypothetical protein B6I36_08160 [Desulfobacteraceae bacterium 4572_35.1]|nr:MAG: hypothetical protein B6I36_08160 [Desulfobacteraceae bacterium 4572_35.1]
MTKKITKLLFAHIILLICCANVSASELKPNWQHMGKLEKFNENHIIISDSEYFLGDRVEYYAFSGKYVSKRDFTEGVKVVLTLRNNTVIAVWLDDKEMP